MILRLLLEVRNLKNITKLTVTITTTIIIVIVITMKTNAIIEVVPIIKYPVVTKLKRNCFDTWRQHGEKIINFFLLTRKLNHKCLVKVRPFISARVRWIHNHAKPTIPDFDPDRIILYCGTNDLNSNRTSSQIAIEIIDLALSLKSDKTKISISLLTSRSDKSNNKASEVSNRLINI